MQYFKVCWFSWCFVCKTAPAVLHGSILGNYREGVTRKAVKTCDFEFGFPSTLCDSAQSFGRQLGGCEGTVQEVVVRGLRAEEVMLHAALVASPNSQKPIVALLC